MKSHLMKILVAEDDLFSRKLLTATLTQFGYEWEACEDGEQACEIFGSGEFRIVISDWLMPRRDGLSLCRKIREDYDDDYTYFILLTANVQGKDSYRQAMDAGIDDFLTKPLDRDQIWMRLRVAERILKYTRQITELESMLPICSYCKKVRDDNNYWQQVESYLMERTGTTFSHSVCPSCYEKVVMPQLNELRGGK